MYCASSLPPDPKAYVPAYLTTKMSRYRFEAGAEKYRTSMLLSSWSRRSVSFMAHSIVEHELGPVDQRPRCCFFTPKGWDNLARGNAPGGRSHPNPPQAEGLRQLPVPALQA